MLSPDVALLVGVLMIVVGVSRVVHGDQQAAYAVGGSLKPAHAVTMHGVLVLPPMAWLLSRTARPEHHRRRIIWLAVAGYAVLCAVVVFESVTGIDPLHASLGLTALGSVGALAITAAALLTVMALMRRESSTRPAPRTPRAARGPVPPA